MDTSKPPYTAHVEAGDKVGAFYNQHPYPPPVADLNSYRQLWGEGDRLRVEYHLLWPGADYRDDLDILVAGCGTSQAAKHAIRQPEANVIGIDISSTSLQHTKDLKRRYKLDNLQVLQLPVERVEDLDCQFDKIVCTGVLHHLSAPDAGLRSLRAVLKPDGAMYLMVYGAYGRTGVTMLQEYSRRLGIAPSDQEIKDLSRVLKELPRGHPLDYLLRETPDFRHPDALADALLNPRERAYTVPQLFDFLTRCGLAFGRWYRQAPYLPSCGVIASTPHSPRLAGLPEKEQYAALELFRGTISSHSFITYHDESQAGLHAIRFDSDDWEMYVPICHPGVICVQERLPSGAAAVLINQDHVHTDLIHPIDSFEKQLFDGIDGAQTISAIVDSLETAKSARLQQARDFFERLWRYDQVVFDKTRVIS